MSRNLITNPSAETGTAGWTALAGSSAGALSNPLGTEGVAPVNLATNPSFEAAGAAFPVRVNLASLPREVASRATYDAATGRTTVSEVSGAPYVGEWIDLNGKDGQWVALGVDVSNAVGVAVLRLNAQVQAGGSTTTSSNDYYPAASGRYTTSIQLPAGATSVRMYVWLYRGTTASRTDAQVGDRVDLTRWHIAIAPTQERALAEVADYFDGSTPATGDFTYAWTGAANASTSEQRALTVAGYAPSYDGTAWIVQSAAWALSGTRSLRIIPRNSTGKAYLYRTAAQLGLTVGKTYTVAATLRLERPQPGTPSGVARSIAFGRGGVYPDMVQAPNMAGEYRLSLTFTVQQASDLLLISNGSTVDDLWLDDLTITEGTEAVPYRDGDSAGWGWTGTPHASTSGPRMGAAVAGSRVLRATFATAQTATLNGASGPTVAVQPGQRLAALASVRTSWATAVSTELLFTDAAGATVGQPIQVLQAVQPAEWRPFELEGVAPAGATGARIRARVATIANGGRLTPAGGWIDVDAVRLSEDELPLAYGDGDTEGWRWDGTVHASTSHELVATRAHATMEPVPRISLVMEGLPSLGAALVTVYAVTPSSLRPVRGGWRLPATSVMVVDDFLAPFGVPVSYSVHLFDAVGEEPLRILQVRGPAIDYDGTIIQHVLDPWLSTKARLLTGSEVGLRWKHDGRLERPGSSRYPTWIGSGRWPLQDIPLKLGTDTAEQEAAMRRVFALDTNADHLPIVAVRTSRRVRWPQPLQAVVAEVEPEGLDWIAGGHKTHWNLTASEVQPPSAAISRPLMAWADVMATYPTWDAVRAAYSTWGAMMTDTELAGASNA